MASILTASQLATAKQIVGYLSGHFPTNSAIAFAGNAAQESSFNPNIWGDGRVSYGLWQWQGSRLDELKLWCAANNLDYASIQGQCAFVIYEIGTPNGAPQIVPWLMDTSNKGQPSRPLATLVADIVSYYERAGVPDLENRINYANQVAKFLGSMPSTAPVVPVVIPQPTQTAVAQTSTSLPAPGGAPIMNPEIIAILAQLLAPTIEGIISGLIKGLSATSSASGASTLTSSPATMAVDPVAIAAALLPQLSTALAPAVATPAIDIGSLVTQIVEGLASKISVIPPSPPVGTKS